MSKVVEIVALTNETILVGGEPSEERTLKLEPGKHYTVPAEAAEHAVRAGFARYVHPPKK